METKNVPLDNFHKKQNYENSVTNKFGLGIEKNNPKVKKHSWTLRKTNLPK
jgi:hypothetical protein